MDEMRLIDANALEEELSSLSMIVTGLRAGKNVLREYMTEYRKSVLRIVDETPTIDAVPVVRCKDCVFLNKRLIVKNRGTHCLTWDRIVNPDNGYCNWGRRKDDVGNG
jgi:hypothetical protein